MPPIYTGTQLNTQYHGLLSSADCGDINCLRRLSIDDFNTAVDRATNLAFDNGDFPYGTFYWGPVIDGRIIRDFPLTELQAGRFAKVPVLVDRSGFEGFFFTDPETGSSDDAVATLQSLWQPKNQTFIEGVLRSYPLGNFNGSLLSDLRAAPSLVGSVDVGDEYGRLQEIIGDVIIDCQTHYIATAVASTGLSAYKSK
jgi:carboxylesterase type B